MREYSTPSWIQCRWEQIAPYFHIIGAVIFVCFTAGVYFTQFQALAKTSEAHTVALAKVEQKLSENQAQFAQINQKLDDIKNYLILPRRGHE